MTGLRLIVFTVLITLPVPYDHLEIARSND
jgi:hypothetical protein